MERPQDTETYRGRFLRRRLTLRRGALSADVRDLETGQVFRLSTDTEDPKRAAAQIRERLDVILRREEEAIEPMPFADALELYFRTRQVRPVSLANYRSHLGRFGALWGGLYTHQVRFRDVEEAFRSLRDRAPATLRHYRTMLRLFYRWACLRGYAEQDPTRGLRLPRATRGPGRALSIEEARRLLLAARAQIHPQGPARKEPPEHPGYLYLALAVALYTGLRRRNALELRWREVDLARRTIELPGSRTKNREPLTVPLHPALERLLRGELHRQGRLDPDSPAIGARVARVDWALRSAVRRAELAPGLRWHDLRHTFATWIGERATYATLKALLGHSSGSVTDRYLHVPLEERRRAVELLPDLLAPPAGDFALHGSDSG